MAQGLGYLKVKTLEGLPSSKRPNAETPTLDALWESTNATSPGPNPLDVPTSARGHKSRDCRNCGAHPDQRPALSAGSGGCGGGRRNSSVHRGWYCPFRNLRGVRVRNDLRHGSRDRGFRPRHSEPNCQLPFGLRVRLYGHRKRRGGPVSLRPCQRLRSCISGACCWSYHCIWICRKNGEYGIVAGGSQHDSWGRRLRVIVNQRLLCVGGEGLPVARCILSTLCSYWHEDDAEYDEENGFSKGRYGDHGAVGRPQKRGGRGSRCSGGVGRRWTKGSRTRPSLKAYRCRRSFRSGCIGVRQ